jgi:hypothetical protein
LAKIRQNPGRARRRLKVDSPVDLAYRGKIKLLPCGRDPDSITDEVIQEWVDSGYKRHNDLILEAREDIALESIDGRKLPISVLVYGGLHDFSDNIGKNQTLVEILPESYKK